MKTVLVTGANRGIGLHLTERLLKDGCRVLAGYRRAGSEEPLEKLFEDFPGQGQAALLDVADQASVDAFASTLGQPLDVLVNNAGIFKEYPQGLEQLSLEALKEVFEVNVVSMLRMTRAALPKLRNAGDPLVVNISSTLGSIEDAGVGCAYGYCISKTGVNMLTKIMSNEFPAIHCLSVHPGWVKTDMGGKDADIEPEESASGLANVIQHYAQWPSGSFIDYRGEYMKY